MDSTPTRLFSATILFLISILLPFALLAEEQTGGAPSADDNCAYVFRSCEADGRSPEEWKECVRVKQPDCIVAQEREYESPKDEYLYERKYQEEFREHQSEEEYEEGSDKDQWLNELRDRASSFSEEDRRCVEEVLDAKEDRCAASSVPDCVAKTAHKTLVQEGKCGLGELNSTEMGNEDRSAGDKIGPKTGMGMPRMIGKPKSDGQHDVGALFGQAVGMLISLSQDPNLPEDVKADVNVALAWFSEKVGAIAGGANAEEFLPDAKAKLEGILQKVGGGSFGGGPDAGRMREEIDRMLKNFHGMLETIPKALERMKELFMEREIEIDFGNEWESLLSTLKKDLAGIEELCSNADNPEEFHPCFEALKDFPPRMERLKRLVEEIVLWRSNVPQQKMNEVMEKVSKELFQKFEMGHPQNSMAPGTAPNGMSPGTMGVPGGMSNPPIQPTFPMQPNSGPGGGQNFPMIGPTQSMPQQPWMAPPPFSGNEAPFDGTRIEPNPRQFTDPQMMPFQEPGAGRDLQRSYDEWERGTEGE